MKPRLDAAVLLLGSVLCGGAAAAPPEAQIPQVVDPRVLLHSLVTEEQVAAMFEYLRNALIAAAEGREGPVPEILRRELDRIDADVKLRGTLAGLMMLKSLEAEIRQLLRDTQPPSGTPAPVPPYQRS
ncbi:MAG: hypothetical protein ACM3SS_03220 [Rhodospirillaceae bacterium]